MRILALSGEVPGVAVSASRPEGFIEELQIRGALLAGHIDGIDGVTWSSIEAELARIERDQQVVGLLLRIDSPGGDVAGIESTRRRLQAVAARMPVYCHVESLLASAAVWLTSVATRIHAERLASIGAVGAYSVVRDFSKAFEAAGIRTIITRSAPLKGAGVPGDRVTDEQEAEIQRIVDGVADAFISDLAQGRKLPVEFVRDRIADGRVHHAGDALSLRLIDRIDTLEGTRAALMQHAMLKRPNPTSINESALTEDERLAREYANHHAVTTVGKWSEMVGVASSHESGRQRALREQELARKFPRFFKVVERARLVTKYRW